MFFCIYLVFLKSPTATHAEPHSNTNGTSNTEANSQTNGTTNAQTNASEFSQSVYSYNTNLFQFSYALTYAYSFINLLALSLLFLNLRTLQEQRHHQLQIHPHLVQLHDLLASQFHDLAGVLHGMLVLRGILEVVLSGIGIITLANQASRQAIQAEGEEEVDGNQHGNQIGGRI